MKLWALGVNHHTAPLAVRERFAVDAGRMTPFLQALQHSRPASAKAAQRVHPAPQSQGQTAQQVLSLAPTMVQEVLVLSTCNRTELFMVGDERAQHDAWLALARHAGLTWEQVKPYSRTRSDRVAIEHILRVAAGLDSMVLGETQISAQIKQAAREAEQAGTLGPVLRRLLQQAYASAKDIRSNTAIGRHSISMAAAVVRLAAQVFEDVAQSRVLLVGAGEMIALVAAHFAAHVKHPLTIANRGRERAQALAAQYGARTIGLPQVSQHLCNFDVVVSCTASLEPVLLEAQFAHALRQRRHKPMVVVDLAVPRDVEHSVAQHEDIYCYTVDDLAQIVQKGRSQRSAALKEADSRVQKGVERFMSWLTMRNQPPIMQALQQQAQTWRDEAVQRALRQWSLGAEPEAVLRQLAHGLLQKTLHGARKEWANSVAHRAHTSGFAKYSGAQCVVPQDHAESTLARQQVQAAIQRFFLHSH